MKRFSTFALLILAGLAASWTYKLAETPETIGYITAALERGSIEGIVTATGTVNAVTIVEVGSQLSGKIQELMADFNDQVVAGQPMARLDPQSYEAAISGARAALEVARASVFIQQAVIERARSAIDSAKAQRDVLQARILGVKATVTQAQLSLQRNIRLRKTLSGAITEEILGETRAKLARARAELTATESQLDVQAQSILMANSDLRKAEAELLSAKALIPEREAKLALAEVTLERTIIRAPIDGVVIDRGIDKGQTVAASLEAPKLFTVAQDLHRMQVYAHIDEADIGKIKAGQTASFTVDAFPDSLFSGVVKTIRKFPQTIQNVVTYTVVISTRNPNLALLPGMTATVDILVSKSTEGPQIPAAALRYMPSENAMQAPNRSTALKSPPPGDDMEAQLWIKDSDGKPRAIQISVKEGDEEVSILTAGDLNPGDEVIINEIRTSGGRRIFGLRLGF